MLFITYIYTLLYYDMVNNNWFINIDIMQPGYTCIFLKTQLLSFHFLSQMKSVAGKYQYSTLSYISELLNLLL